MPMHGDWYLVVFVSRFILNREQRTGMHIIIVQYILIYVVQTNEFFFFFCGVIRFARETFKRLIIPSMHFVKSVIAYLFFH